MAVSFVLYAGLQGGHMFFSAVKEGDQVVFASDDEQDRVLWVQAIYRATGQSYKPVPTTPSQRHNCRGGGPQRDAPVSLLSRSWNSCTVEHLTHRLLLIIYSMHR